MIAANVSVVVVAAKGGMMATCDDLVNAVLGVYEHIDALSINIDALRQSVECQTQLLRQALPDRDFIAQYCADSVAQSIKNTNQVTQTLHQLSQALSARDLPEQLSGTESVLSPDDLDDFLPCSITKYCPPGQVRDEEGNCVPESA
jgi:tetrahydromethanopterin S-methyltransferase subunit B